MRTFYSLLAFYYATRKISAHIISTKTWDANPSQGCISLYNYSHVVYFLMISLCLSKTCETMYVRLLTALLGLFKQFPSGIHL